MDLDRRVREVLGARFGGGGATRQDCILVVHSVCVLGGGVFWSTALIKRKSAEISFPVKSHMFTDSRHVTDMSNTQKLQ